MEKQVIDKLVKRYPKFEVRFDPMDDDTNLQLNCKDSIHSGGTYVCLIHVFELESGDFVLTVFMNEDKADADAIGDLEHVKMKPYKFKVNTLDEVYKMLDKVYAPLVKIQEAFNQNDIIKAGATLNKVGFTISDKNTCKYVLNVCDYQIQIQLGYADAFLDEIVLYNACVSDYSLGYDLIPLDSKEFIALTFEELKEKMGL